MSSNRSGDKLAPGSPDVGTHDGHVGHPERLVGGYTGRLLISLSATYLAIQFGRNILSPLLPAIIDDLAISPFQAGLALTLIAVTYALSMYPGGRLSDRLSRKTILVAAAGISVLAFVLLTIASVYLLLLLGAAILGIGAGLYWIALRALLADLFTARRGQAFGVQDALGFVGPFLAAGGAVTVLAVAYWNMAFLPILVVLLGSIVLTHVWLNEPYELGWIETDAVATGYRVFGNAHVRRLIVAYTSGIFAMQAVIGFLPLFLQVEHGFSDMLSSLGFAVLFLGAIVTMPVAGFLGDRIAYTPVAVGGLGLSLLGLLTIVLADSTGVILLGVLGFGLGIWAFPPVIQAHLFTHLPTESMGGDYGAFKTVYSGVGGLGPLYVGVIAGVWSYSVAFLGLVVFLLLAMGIFSRV